MEGEEKLLLSLATDLRITHITALAGTLCVSAVSEQVASSCPLCDQPSQSIHSRYWRIIADVPCSPQRVFLNPESALFAIDTQRRDPDGFDTRISVSENTQHLLRHSMIKCSRPHLSSSFRSGPLHLDPLFSIHSSVKRV